MERLRECAKKIWGIGDTVGLPGYTGVTVEDILVELLSNEGF